MKLNLCHWFPFWYKFLRSDHGRVHAAWKAIGMCVRGRAYMSNTKWKWAKIP